jgi:hypothetical protein
MAENVNQTSLVPAASNGQPQQLQPVESELSFDSIMKSKGIAPNREFRVSYDLKTREGMLRKYRHQSLTGDENIKAGWVNKVFSLVAVTSWPCRTTREDGEEVMFIRSVMETADGELIPSGSSYLLQSLNEIVVMCGGIGDDKPVRVRIVKAGRTDMLECVDLLEGTGPFADASVASKSKPKSK